MFSQNCEKQVVNSALKNKTKNNWQYLLSSSSWHGFTEWAAPTCLTHHFPPHCKRGGVRWMMGKRRWGELRVGGVQCPCFLLPSSCPSSMVSQSGALGIANKQNFRPTLKCHKNLLIPVLYEQETDRFILFFFFFTNISSWEGDKQSVIHEKQEFVKLRAQD